MDTGFDRIQLYCARRKRPWQDAVFGRADELHRFDDILKESAFDTNKALSLFKEEQKQFDYSSMLVDALTKELNDQDLRNRIRQDFNVTSHVL